MSAAIREAIISEMRLVQPGATGRAYVPPAGQGWVVPAAAGFGHQKALAECIARGIGGYGTWQQPVIRRRAQPYEAEGPGERYLATATGGGWTVNHIYESAEGGTWIDVEPVDGMLIWVCEEETLYLFDGSNWTPWSSSSAGAHALVSATHTASGLTAGHFLKALSATTFGFAAHGLSYTDVGAAASGHNHDGVYAAAGHNHSGVYDPAGTATAAVSAHVSASDPHAGYLLANGTRQLSGAWNANNTIQATRVGFGVIPHATEVLNTVGRISFSFPVDQNSLNLTALAANSVGAGINFNSNTDAAPKSGLLQLDGAGNLVLRALSNPIYLDYTSNVFMRSVGDGYATKFSMDTTGNAVFASALQAAKLTLGAAAGITPLDVTGSAAALFTLRVGVPGAGVLWGAISYSGDAFAVRGTDGKTLSLGANNTNDYLTIGLTGAVALASTLTVTTIAAHDSPASVFLTQVTGLIKSRTAAQVLSDIGAAASGHNHDGVYATAGHNHSGVYDPAGTAAAAVSAHVSASDPHTGYLLANGTRQLSGAWNAGNAITGTNITGAQLRLLDTSQDHTLGIQLTEELTAHRNLVIAVGDALRQITLQGDPTLANWFDQSVKIAATPKFARVGIGTDPHETASLALGSVPAVLLGTSVGSVLTQRTDLSIGSRSVGLLLDDIGAAAAGHNHSGTYDPAGTAAAAVSSHEGSYSHALLHAQSHALVGGDHTASGLTAGHFLKALSATTFGFAAHGLSYGDVGAAASGHNHDGVYATAGHNHSGVYDPAGTAAAAVSSHQSTYSHANYNTAYGWGNHAGLYLPIGGGTLTGALSGTSATMSSVIAATYYSGTPSYGDSWSFGKTDANYFDISFYNMGGAYQPVMRFKDDGTAACSTMLIDHIKEANAAHGIALDHAVTCASTVQATAASNEVIVARSGNAANWTAITVGRTSHDGYFAVSGAANTFVAGDVAGDTVVKAVSGNALWLVTSGARAVNIAPNGATALSVASAGAVTCASRYLDTACFYSTRYTEHTDSGHENYWYPLVTVDIPYRYQYATAVLIVSGNSTAENLGGMVMISLRVKQQAALGSPPVVEVMTPVGCVPLFPMDVVFDLTTNDASHTAGTLYIRVRRSYESVSYTVLNREGYCSVVASNTAGVSALPAGTQYASYGGITGNAEGPIVYGREEEASVITMTADAGGDNNDYSRFYTLAGNYLWQEYAGGSWRTNLGMDASGYIYSEGINRASGTGTAVKINTSTMQVYKDSSALAYKTDVQDWENSVSGRNVLDLRLRQFKYRDWEKYYEEYTDKDGKAKTRTLSRLSDHASGPVEIGLIAEEVADILPEVVGYTNGKPDYINYDRLVVPLISEVKKLRDRIEQLEKAA